METVLNKFKGQNSEVETAENDLSNNSKKVTKVKSFSDYGIKKSGLNRGDAASLKIHLNWIKDGFVVDENYDSQAASEKRKTFEVKIEDKKPKSNKYSLIKKSSRKYKFLIKNKTVRILKTASQIFKMISITRC